MLTSSREVKLLRLRAINKKINRTLQDFTIQANRIDPHEHFFFVKEEMNVKFPVTKLSFTQFHLSMVPLLQYSTFCTFATFSSKYYPIYVSPVLGLSLLCFCPPARLFAASRIRHFVNKLQRTKVWKVDGFIRGKITHKFSTRDYHHSFTRRKTKIFPFFHDVPPNFQHKYNSFN